MTLTGRFMSLPGGVRLACVLLMLGAATPACDCGTNGPARTAGKLVLSPSPVAFGTVVIGEQKEIDVTATNDGRNSVNIASIQTGPAFPSDFRFSPANLLIEPGASVTLKVYFVPSKVGMEAGTLLFLDTLSGTTTKLDLSGEGVKAVITVDPTMIDFGMTVVGEVSSKTVTVTNGSNAALDVLVDPVVSATPGAFVVSLPGSSQTTTHIDPNGTTQISVSFQPSQTGEQMGTFDVRACSSCTPVTVSLQGEGMASGLLPIPASIDFGAVLPMETSAKPLTLKNIGNTPITINAIAPQEMNGPFSIDGITLPYDLMPGASTMLNVHFAPTALGAQATNLTFNTDDAAANTTLVPLTGAGGGPTALVAPTTLNYGTVGIGFPVTRQFYVTNVGAGGSSAAYDSLVVSAIDVPAGSGFALAASTMLPITLAPSARQAIQVQFNPAMAGPAMADLVLHTNDMAHPMITVHLLGTGVVAGPCSYVLSPAPNPGLQFGIVSRGRTSTQMFSLRNTGTSDCIIGKMELTASTDPSFSLPNGSVYGQTLAPGAELLTPVQFYPPGTTPPGTTLTGAVDLEISSQSMPSQQLALSGTAAEVCITISPTSADFGVVKPMCTTNEVNFDIYNSCSEPVKITKIQIGAGAPDFVLLAPGVPVSLQPQNAMTYMSGVTTSTSFQVKFRPSSVGSDIGNVSVYTDETFTHGQPYVVPLTGRGDSNANGQDLFTQGQQQKVDVLIVADDSGSMADKQAEVAANYGAFMQYAIQHQIDYHIAVTTTSTDSLPTCTGGPPNAINGMFMPLMGQNRIITPQTPNAAMVFATNVNVGTDGCGDEQGMEGAYRALSEPNINGTNAGFLRPDAALAIVLVSDDEDSSPRPVDFYENFFRSLKGPNGANMVTFNAVIAPPNDPAAISLCNQNMVYYEPTAIVSGGGATALRYPQLIQATGGVEASICDPNWANSLQQIGMVAFGYKSRFVLTSTPDPTTIAVLINGMPVSASYWTYSASTNSVDFLPTAIPPAGASIEVDYTVACQ